MKRPRSSSQPTLPAAPTVIMLKLASLTDDIHAYHVSNTSSQTVHHVIRGPSNNITPLSTDEDFLVLFLQKRNLKVKKGLNMRREIPDTEYERWILSTPSLTDYESLPDESKSTVTILTLRDRHVIGDKFCVRVDLNDGRGRPRQSGGDEVRIWLTSSSLQAGRTSVAAEVTDMRNGSYLGETVLPWTGLAVLKVSLTYPREYLRLMVTVRHTVHTLRWLSANFSDGVNATEMTACISSGPVPGYEVTCNMTSHNGGIPWFCGRPTDARLNCSQWTGEWGLVGRPYLKDMSLPLPETLMSQKIYSPPFMRLLPTTPNFFIWVAPASKPSQRLPPCWSTPPRETWENPAPRGWFDRNTWRPMTCSLPSMTPEHVQKCLRNTTLFLLGDSNMRNWWDGIRRALKCTRVENGWAWHAPRLCEVNHENTHVRFAAHGMPFARGSHRDLQIHPISKVLRQLQQLPRHTNIILVIHYFAHFVAEALHAYRDRLRTAKHLLQNFLDSRPSAKVFIRGPHVFYDNIELENDYFGAEYIRMWREEFRPLYDKVWFMNYWDLTIAAENMSLHPPEVISAEMLFDMFGHFCEGEPIRYY